MGGTVIRLVAQGHGVHVAYMTSGNIAVFDHDARRFADFVVEFNRLFGIDGGRTEALRENVRAFLDAKRPGQPDPEDRPFKRRDALDRARHALHQRGAD